MALAPTLGLLALIVSAPLWVRGSGRFFVAHKRLFPGRGVKGGLEVSFTCPLPVFLRAERESATSLSLLPGGRRALAWCRWAWQETVDCNPRRRGKYLLPKVRVSARYLLGLWEREVVVPFIQDEVLVYPFTFEMPAPNLLLTLLADGPETAGGIEDPARVAGVRDYLPGDPVNRFHWKATARQGHPMVKELARVRSSSLWVHLDLQTFESRSTVYVEHAASLAGGLLVAAEKESLALGLSCGTYQSEMSRGPRHLARLLALLAMVQGEADPSLVPAPPPGASMILITQEASPSIVEGALKARVRASRVQLVLLPEGFYLLPGEKGRPMFGKTEGVLRLLKKRLLLQAEGVDVKIVRGNDRLLQFFARPFSSMTYH